MAYQQRRENMERDNRGDKLGEFIGRLKKGAIANIPTSELVKPNGYAWHIARELGITMVQLRKVYSELKYIFERVSESGELDESMKTQLYMLYPILEYQKNRKVISGHFVKLMNALLENLEKNESPDNFKQADRFLTALVAYMKQEGQR